MKKDDRQALDRLTDRQAININKDCLLEANPENLARETYAFL